MTKYNVRLTVCAVATTTCAVSTLIAGETETHSPRYKQADIFREDTASYAVTDLMNHTLQDISSLPFKIRQSIYPNFIHSVSFNTKIEYYQTLGKVGSNQHQTTLLKENKETSLSNQEVDTENSSLSTVSATQNIGNFENTLGEKYYQTTYYHPSNHNKKQLNCIDSKDCGLVPTIPEPVNILSLSVIGGFSGASVYQKYKQS
ncbi:MAG: hypothetical protein SAK29_15530 [Scytonema sp. PMC 1069.18]|nr:hypothetical protein [Scytonema sp. PMC 1069.18]MEC4885897.1 hypothetical protein [Scytonema sp. PMC 1070.18]